MLYNPLLDCFVTPKSYREQWQDIVDSVAKAVEKAARKNDFGEAMRHLHFMDLLDVETAAWWREEGLDLVGSSTDETSYREDDGYETSLDLLS